jgi:hypothetical protein
MLELDVTLEVVVAGVVLATDVARKGDRCMRLLVTLEIMFAREALSAGEDGTTEGTAVEVLVPDVVVQVIEPLARVVLVDVVVGVEPLLGSVNSTVPEQAPSTAFMYLSKLSSDERGRYGRVGVSLLVVEDVESRLLLVWGKVLGD